jgi:hypothetical protein
MTAVKYVGGLIRGTNAERIALSTTNLRAGWLFVCSDTLDIYYWTGAVWTVITNATGEANTASNVGTGQGVWKAKTGVDLSFRSLTATSSKIALANNANDIGIDVTEANLTLDNLGGTLGVAKGGTGATTLTGFLKGSGTSAITAAALVTGDIPTTLTGKTLTTATVDAELNTLDHTTVMPSKKKVGWYAGQNNPATAYGTTGMWNGACSANVTGTGAVSVITRNSAGTRFNYTTGTTINSTSGFRINSILLTERDLNPVTEWRIQLGQTADCRMAFGYSSLSAASTAGADPLANLSGVMFFYDSGVDTEWMIAQNSGGASSDRTTITNIATADTAVHNFAIRADNANTKFQYAYGYTNLSTATWVDINTVIPAASTGLGWTQYMENLVGTAKTWAIYWMQGWQDA